ncbi:hypothetical protein [Rummeliibacillus stabekisii]|uniref:Uncharacterized protein n=1 Tax=Rummeliibacillus stabekisii TaxID=241244 RepID=A0A143HCY4_9BACL|nr:hypothetical protein [Rummeliibacillus stabekisii]AMW99330.1 hypothetical protein ATY39_07545 [Rummeliibacillus stabekisii]
MKPTFIGFGPTTAKAVIFWLKEDDIVSKTVCYSEQDLQDMLDKHSTLGSLYNSFDYEVEYINAHEGVA